MRTRPVTILAVAILTWGVVFDATAQMPRTLNYQGTLAVGSTPVPDGNYNVTFRLYTGPSGGSAVWTEAQLVSSRNGVFNAILGKIVPLPASFNLSYWMSLQVGADTELSPRLEMTGVTYSMHSAMADSARNVTIGSIGTVQLANGAVTSAKMGSAGSQSGQVLTSNGSSVTWGRVGLLNVTASTLPPRSLAPVTSTSTKIADLTTFEKISATSVVEVLFDGRLSVEGPGTATGGQFLIRIDDSPPSSGVAIGTVKASELGLDGVSTHITGIFTGLSSGNHTVSIWVRATGGTAATAAEAWVNVGNWGAQLVVKEID